MKREDLLRDEEAWVRDVSQCSSICQYKALGGHTPVLDWEERRRRVGQKSPDIPTSSEHFRTSTQLRKTIRKIRRAKNEVLDNAAV